MPIPTNLELGTVYGWFARVTADAADPDKKPEGSGIADLNVVFIPEVDEPAVFRNVTATPPVTLKIDPILCTTNTDGDIHVLEDASIGVVMPASSSAVIDPSGWTWRVEVWGDDFPRIAFSFVLNPGQVLDLSTVVPVPPNPGLELIEWQQAVSQAIAAKNAAAQSAASVNRGQANGVAALNAAGKALDAAGKILLDVDTANTSYARFTDAAGAPIPNSHARIVFAANGDIEDIILEGN